MIWNSKRAHLCSVGNSEPGIGGIYAALSNHHEQWRDRSNSDGQHIESPCQPAVHVVQQKAYQRVRVRQLLEPKKSTEEESISMQNIESNDLTKTLPRVHS